MVQRAVLMAEHCGRRAEGTVALIGPQVIGGQALLARVLLTRADSVRRSGMEEGLALCFSIIRALTMAVLGAFAALGVKPASWRWSGLGELARRAPALLWRPELAEGTVY